MWTPPGLDNISKKLRQDLRAQMPGSDPFVWPNNLYVALKVFALAIRAIYLRLSKLHLMAHVSKAVGDYLDLHAADRGTSRLPPTLASGVVAIIGAPLYVVAAGYRLLRIDGQLYEVTADVGLSAGGLASASIVALDPGGAGNCEAGTALTPETPDDNLTSVLVDDSGIIGGADVENDSSLRERLLDLNRNPPHGGSPSEYVRWTRSVTGVTRVFIQRATPDAGHVTIVFMMDDAYSDGVPLAGDIATVTGVLDDNAPASAELHVTGPTPVPVDITLTALSPNTRKVKDAVTAELQAAFRRLAEPGAAGEPFTFSRSWIEEAISNASGEDAHTMTVPAGNVTVEVDTGGNPEIAVLGVVTFP